MSNKFARVAVSVAFFPFFVLAGIVVGCILPFALFCETTRN